MNKNVIATMVANGKILAKIRQQAREFSTAGKSLAEIDALIDREIEKAGAEASFLL